MSPIDARIPLGIQPIQVPSPLETISTIAQLQGIREQTETRRLAADEARQKAKDAAAVRQILTETGGDMAAALPRLRQVAPAMALEFETEMAQANNQRLQGATHEMTLRRKELELVADWASQVTDEASARRVGNRLRRFSPEVTDLLPGLDEPYDPARWQGLRDLSLTGAQRYDKSQTNLNHFLKGEFQEGLGGALSDATNQQEWDQSIQTFLDLGGPPSVATMFGAYSPENVTRAGQLAITPAKETELAGQAAGRAQTAAHQGVLEAQGAQRIAQARQRLAQGTGSTQDSEALIQAVIENPGLWDQITPTERGKIAGELNARGFTGFGKPLSDAAVKQISDSTSAIASLTDLRGVLQANEQYIGPIAGLQALNPYSEARKAQADIDRVRQRVGKALEGGVLRKEDEEKYKKILATLTDVPSTAIYKVDQLIQDIQRDIETYKHQQRLAGRRVGPTETPAGVVTRPSGATPGTGGLTYEDYLNARKPRP